MKLSEAIRLGAAMKPQAFDAYFDNGGTCALGAAGDALGDVHLDDNIPNTWPKEWSATEERIAKAGCPECGETKGVSRIVPHLNDYHRWTRERIADFVELHEGLPQPSEPIEAETCSKK